MKLHRIHAAIAAGLLCAGVSTTVLADTTAESESPVVQEEAPKEAGSFFARYFAKIDQILSRAQLAVAKASPDSPDAVTDVVTQIRETRQNAAERLNEVRGSEVDLATIERRKALEVQLQELGASAQDAYKRALSSN